MAAATIRSFSARDQRRRRCTDVITSTCVLVIVLALVIVLGLDGKTHLRQGGLHRMRADLQARGGCGKKLAPSQRAQPVAENHPRGKVHRRNRGRQIASSSRCRLTPSVTKIWR